MKRTKSILIVICALALILVVTACGGKNDNTPTPTDEPTTEEKGFDISSVDYSNPTVVVELDDVTAMEKLTDDAQNMRIEEGTVVKVTGKISQTQTSVSLMASRGDGSSIGIGVIVEGDWTPENGKVAEVVGVMVKGKFYMEFHALPANIKM